MDCAPCVSLALNFRRSSVMACPEDACMLQEPIGIRRTSQTRLWSRVRPLPDVYKHLYSTNTRLSPIAYLHVPECVQSVVRRYNCCVYDSLIGRRRSGARPALFLPLLSTPLELAGPQRSGCFFPNQPPLPAPLGSIDLGVVLSVSFTLGDHTLSPVTFQRLIVPSRLALKMYGSGEANHALRSVTSCQ